MHICIYIHIYWYLQTCMISDALCLERCSGSSLTIPSRNRFSASTTVPCSVRVCGCMWIDMWLDALVALSLAPSHSHSRLSKDKRPHETLQDRLRWSDSASSLLPAALCVLAWGLHGTIQASTLPLAAESEASTEMKPLLSAGMNCEMNKIISWCFATDELFHDAWRTVWWWI